MSGSGREALTGGRGSSRISGSGLETILDVREWSVDPHGSPGVVGKSSRMSGSGMEALPEVREWS